MSRSYLGSVIRDMRKRAGLTQEELASGICSPVSISRIENGAQLPSGKVLEALLSRLGSSICGLSGIFYKSDSQLEFDSAAELAAQHIKCARYDEAAEILVGLEQASHESPLNRQTYLLLEASIGMNKGEKAESMALKLESAFAQTKPETDPLKLEGALLTHREANILSVLMVAYYHSGMELRAIELGKVLLDSLDKQASSLKEHELVRLNAALNLSQLMEKNGWHTEAAHYIEMAERRSLELREHAFLPEILFLKAKNLHNRGDDEECLRILRAILPYMELIDKKDYALTVRKFLNSIEKPESDE